MKSAIITKFAPYLLALSAIATLTSCGNTVDGIKQDTHEMIYQSKVVVIDAKDLTIRKTNEVVNRSAEAVKEKAEAVVAATQ